MADPAFQASRQNMVDGQLRPNRINAPDVLARYQTLPRERFVPPKRQHLAYMDAAIELGHDRVMLSPLVSAHLVQGLHIQPTDHVLIVPAGTGYEVAVIAALAGQVTALEDEKLLLTQLKNNLQDVDEDVPLGNITTQAGGLSEGCAGAAPFDVIVIPGCVYDVPAPLIQQLKPAGRLGCIMPGADGVPELTIGHKQGKTLFKHALFETPLPFLPQAKASETFVF